MSFQSISNILSNRSLKKANALAITGVRNDNPAT